jgi:hypothetical protein
MTAKVTIPNVFATATTAIPLSQLDANFTNLSSSVNNALTYSNYAADVGTVNNYIITIAGVTTTYAVGIRFQFLAATTNTANSSLNVNGQGTKAITLSNGNDLPPGAIETGALVDVIYNGVAFQIINPSVEPVEIASIITDSVISPTVDTATQYNVTGLAENTTFDPPTGTVSDGKKLIIRIKDDGTSRTIAWDAIYRGIGVTLPAVTLSNKVLYVGCIYNEQDTKWDVLGVNQEV